MLSRGLLGGAIGIRLVALSTYSSLEAEFHDPFWEAEGPAAELPLLRDFLAFFPGRCVEIGSGSGRLLLPLLQEGTQLEGIEPSSDMLLLCHQKATAAGLKPILHHGTVEALNLPGPYAAAVVPAFTLQLTDDPAAFLQAIHRFLESDGGLYLSVFRPEAELSGEIPQNTWYPDYETRLQDGRIASLETRHRLDTTRKHLLRDHRYLLMDSSRKPISTHECSQRLHWFSNSELFNLIEQSGFEIARAFGEFDPDDDVHRDSPDRDHQIVTIHATKA